MGLAINQKIKQKKAKNERSQSVDVSSVQTKSPPHEKLIDQLEADLFEQHKLLKQEQQKYDANPGIIGRFVKKMFHNKEEHENEQNVKEVIDIKHRKPTSIASP